MKPNSQFAETANRVRLLAVIPSAGNLELWEEVQLLNFETIFVDRVEDLGRYVRDGETYDVALLPASLPDLDCWTVWGELGLLDRRPAVLVYAQTASFQLWSGVLEAGGYDVLVAPFTHERIKESVLRACRSFREVSSSHGVE
jgi:DNA-binding NtrC family response regulator